MLLESCWNLWYCEEYFAMSWITVTVLAADSFFYFCADYSIQGKVLCIWPWVALLPHGGEPHDLPSRCHACSSIYWIILFTGFFSSSLLYYLCWIGIEQLRQRFTISSYLMDLKWMFYGQNGWCIFFLENDWMWHKNTQKNFFTAIVDHFLRFQVIR